MRVSRFHPPPPYALTPSRSSSRHLVFFSTHPLFPSGFLSPHRGSTGSPAKAELATICCFLETKFSRVRSDTETAFASRVAAGASFWRGCPFSVAGRFCVRKRTACAVAFASPTPDPAPLNPPSHCGAFGSPAFAEIVFRDGRGKREDRPRKQTWRHRGRAGGSRDLTAWNRYQSGSYRYRRRRPVVAKGSPARWLWRRWWWALLGMESGGEAGRCQIDDGSTNARSGIGASTGRRAHDDRETD